MLCHKMRRSNSGDQNMRMKTNLIIRNNKIRGSNTRKESFWETKTILILVIIQLSLYINLTTTCDGSERRHMFSEV